MSLSSFTVDDKDDACLTRFLTHHCQNCLNVNSHQCENIYICGKYIPYKFGLLTDEERKNKKRQRNSRKN